jgi:NADPH:quinone reductase-like Zn-dependent oxidoreductase
MKNNALTYRQFGEPDAVLTLHSAEKGPLAADALRVQMLLAPVNASDLIPVTGAYRHRITLPAVAGYEGVGRAIAAPEGFHHLLGRRVLPLRGEGTWQQLVDCPATLAIPVPDEIDSPLAARAFINPLAALLMLRRYSVRGKQVTLTAAGSDCAILLGQWAQRCGATAVYGIHRSPVHAGRLTAMGITPVAQQDSDTVRAVAEDSEVVFDATGGALAQTLLDVMPKCGTFVSYGLLSGQPFTLQHHHPQVHWFHVRNTFASLRAEAWQAEFQALWPLLMASQYSDGEMLPFAAWRDALALYRQPGRSAKPLLKLADL